jgi:tight adherence protein C
VGRPSVGQRLGRPLVAALGRLGRRLTPVGTPQRLRHRLDLAGNTGLWTAESLFALKAVGTVVLGGTGLLGWLSLRSSGAALAFVVLTATGYWLSDLLLLRAGRQRQALMRRLAPDALDMLTVCVEAGLGFDAALAQVAGTTRGPLAAEFARVLREIQLGRSRAEAFSDLARRTDVAEIKGFVFAVLQADRLGVPMAAVLREQAVELRVRRRQHAEERAQKVPVKIVFPVLFCIFPTFFVVVIGPGAIRIVQLLVHG